MVNHVFLKLQSTEVLVLGSEQGYLSLTKLPTPNIEPKGKAQSYLNTKMALMCVFVQLIVQPPPPSFPDHSAFALPLPIPCCSHWPVSRPPLSNKSQVVYKILIIGSTIITTQTLQKFQESWENCLFCAVS